MEQEIKLQVVQADMLDLQQLAQLAGSEAAPQQHQLLNQYFDTPDLQLLQRRLGLRLRCKDGEWLQTVKTSGRAVNGLHQRQEWEFPLATGRFDLDLLRQTPLAALIDDAVLWAQLAPVFSTDFSRYCWRLWRQGTEIELAYDRGRVIAGHAESPIHEIELELVSGELAELQALAQQLSQQLPLQANDQSKAAQGYALLLANNRDA